MFNNPEIELPSRCNATWNLEREEAGMRLYFSTPTERWNGSPSEHWQDGDLENWLIGYLWGERVSTNPVDWPGHFILLSHDLHKRNWHIRTNRCGTFHVYHASNGCCTALGSFSIAVAEANSQHQLDWEALGGFFSLGFFPEDRTYYQDVKIVRPSSHLIFDKKGKLISSSREWDWQYQLNNERSFDDSVDAFAGLFHQIMEEQITGKRVALPISGGLDSRSTVAALNWMKLPTENLWPFSYGYTHDSVETSIARQVARAGNLDINSFTIQPYLFEKFDLVQACVEGFYDVTQCRQAFLEEEFREHSDYVIAAHWGDVWLDDIGLAGQGNTLSASNLADYSLKKFLKNDEWLIENVCKSAAPNLNITDYLHDMLETEFGALANIADPDFRVKALKMEQWSWRWTTASLRMYQPGTFPLPPFYDPRMVDFFCTVPTDFVKGRRLQIAYLKRYAPRLARVPWQIFDANLYWYPYFGSLLLPKRIVKKIKRVIYRGKTIERNWEVQFLCESGRRGFADWLLKPDLKIHDLVDCKQVRTLVDNLYTHPTRDNGYSVAMLLTFSDWLERYG